MGLDIIILKIWGLDVKGLQSWQSNFENDLTPGELEFEPTGSNGVMARWQTFS